MSNDGNKMSNVKNTKPDAVLLGNAIVEARRKKKLTQQQLADALGVTNKTVSKWECGRGLPDQSMFLPLEQILEISVDDYVTEELSDGYTRTAKIISRVALISIAVILAISGILIIVSLTVTDPPVVAHECAHVCPICGGCTTDCADPVCVVKCNKHYDVEGTGVYVFEAEDCDYSDGLFVANDGGSGKGYLANFDFHGGETMVYRFSSRNEVTARLYFALVSRGINDVCNDTYTITVNGEELYSRAVFRGNFVGWQAFTEYYIAEVALHSGDNLLEVRYNINDTHNNGHNFDYIKLNTRPYEKSADILFEAEESVHDESLRTRNEIGSGLGYLGDFDENDGATLTFDFVCDVAEIRGMFFGMASRGINDRMDETYTITLNGEIVSSNSVIHGTFDGYDRWTDFKEYFVANVPLVAGNNRLQIVFHSNATAVKLGNNGHNFDYVRFARSAVYDYDGNNEFVDARHALIDKQLKMLSTSDGKPFVGEFDRNDLAEVRFFLRTTTDMQAALTLNMVPRGLNELINDSFDIYVNGVAVLSDTVISGEFVGFENFVDYFVANIALKSGDNEILLVFKSNQYKNNGHNIGGIRLTPCQTA